MIVPRLADELKGGLTGRRPTLLERDSILVFTCGAQKSHDSTSVRTQVMEYAEHHLPSYRFFEAETFFSAFENTANTDLLSLEGELADYSDCILIFLESSGAFTELGAFAASDRLVQQILAVNDLTFKSTPSFINLGPLKKIDSESQFKPVVYADYSTILTSLPEIEARLGKIRRKRRKPIDISNYDAFRTLVPKYRMMLLHDIISYWSPILRTELITLLTYIYGDHSYDVHTELAMLRATQLITMEDGYYITTLRDSPLFFEIGPISKTKYRSLIIAYYFQNDYNRFRLLAKRVNTSA